MADARGPAPDARVVEFEIPSDVRLIEHIVDAVRRTRTSGSGLSSLRDIRATLRVVRTVFVRHNNNLIRKLVKTGNSVALILSKDMRDHLGVEDEVNVEYLKGEIRLSKPPTVREASARSDKKFADAYRKLAE